MRRGSEVWQVAARGSARLSTLGGKLPPSPAPPSYRTRAPLLIKIVISAKELNTLQKENQKECSRMLGVTPYCSIQQTLRASNLITPVPVPLEMSSFNLEISLICTINSDCCIRYYTWRGVGVWRPKRKQVHLPVFLKNTAEKCFFFLSCNTSCQNSMLMISCIHRKLAQDSKE